MTTTFTDTWHDPARGRDIPVLVRLPDEPGPAPAVLLSHGLGGSREGLAYLGTAFARAGFVAVHLQHRGSDSAIWQGQLDPRAGLAAAIMDPRTALNRLEDVVFALDRLPDEARLAGRVDPARLAAAGHSFGAWTVSHLLGERLPLPVAGLRLPDPRLRAGVALSPIPPIGVLPALAYVGVSAPVLHVTGTEDRGIEAPSWDVRATGYRMASSPGVLAVLAGANHAAFAGEAAAGGYWNDPTYQRRVARLSVLFLRAVLDDDARARELLRAGDGLAPADRIEAKRF